MSKGVGQYWDWSFPYFAEHMSNFFTNYATAWSPSAGGSPLGYASDYGVRLLLSLFGFLPPELLLYVIMVLLFSAGAYGVYSVARQYTSPGLSFVLALAAFINPAMFYKFTAGHLDYFISYVLFIYLVRFLLLRFDRDLKSLVFVGVMLGLVGAQIQFFVIAGFLLTMFAWQYRERIAWKYTWLVLVLPLLLNVVWLSNFLVGGTSLADVSANAAKVTFKALSGTDYLSIFSFAFSKATLIARFYTIIELFAYIALFVLLAIMLVRRRQSERQDMLLLSFLLVMIFMATGLFQLIPLGPLATFYPMLREVGHFAGPIVLMVMLLLARLIRQDRIGWAAMAVLVVAIAVSLGKFQNFHQPIDYAAVRSAFAEFAKHDAKQSRDNHRVLAYPFFDQYAIKQFSTAFQDGLPLQNSGHDSFSTYANQSFIKSAVKPQDFANSVQNRLLQTMDVEVLRAYNVHYIYDYSNIYESYYDRYVPKSTYNNDLALIKNDRHFLDKLQAKNPGKVQRISPHILEITDYMPRVAATDSLFAIPETAAIDPTMQFVSGALQKQFFYTTDQNASQSTALTRLFDTGAGDSFLNTQAKTFNQTFTAKNDTTSTLYANQQKLAAWYQVQDGQVTILARPTGALSVNNQELSEQKASKVLRQLAIKKDQRLYAGVRGQMREITSGNTPLTKIADLNPGDNVQLFTASDKNLIGNGSFESGLWQAKPTDCNNYDQSPQIGMKLAEGQASDGTKALELSAAKHDACTSTEMKLESNSYYLLSYDYQSDNAAVASFYLAFNNSNDEPVKGFQAITNNRWNHAKQLFATPDHATNGRLYAYAIESNRPGDATVNRYDNFRLVKLQLVGEFTVPAASQKFISEQLPGGNKQIFSFTDQTYDYQNRIHDGGFEAGLWQPKPGDCNNYDKEPAIGMQLSTVSKAEGKQSLELAATRHAACTYTTVNVQEGTDYQLSFSYQGDPAMQYGYHIGFDDPKNSEASEKLPITDNKWHTFTKTIHVPARAGTLTLHLYAYESNGSTKNIVRYDNVRLLQLPPLDDRYYVVSEPIKRLQVPQKIAYTSGAASKQIHVTGANQPFYLLLSESYHPKWQLSLGNVALPGGNHIRFNDYGNAWYIDPQTMCKNGACRQTANGYDMDMTARFMPQQQFAMAQAVTAISFVLSVVYLVLAFRKKRSGPWRLHG